MHRMTPCEACGEYSLPILLCADCDRACHAECLPRKQAPSNALVWRCSDCRGERPHDGEMPLVVEARAPPPPRLYVRSPAAPSGKPVERASRRRSRNAALCTTTTTTTTTTAATTAAGSTTSCAACAVRAKTTRRSSCARGATPAVTSRAATRPSAPCRTATTSAPSARPRRRRRPCGEAGEAAAAHAHDAADEADEARRARDAANDLAVGARVEVKHGYGGVCYPGRVDEAHRVAGGNTKCVCPCCVSLAARAATENSHARARPPLFSARHEWTEGDDEGTHTPNVHVGEGPGSVLHDATRWRPSASCIAAQRTPARPVTQHSQSAPPPRGARALSCRPTSKYPGTRSRSFAGKSSWFSADHGAAARRTSRAVGQRGPARVARDAAAATRRSRRPLRARARRRPRAGARDTRRA